MISWSSAHTLTAEMHGGMLMLAFICIMMVALSQLAIAYKTRFPDFLIDVAIKVRGYAEATGFFAAIGGFVGLLLSSYTGMYAWPQETLLLSEEVRNKITLTIFAIVLWAMVLFIRMRFGRGLWTCPKMATVYTVVAMAAMAITGACGSVGAHLTAGESLLDPVWEQLKITISEGFVLQPALAGVMALVGIAGLILSLVFAKKKDLFNVKLGPETCQRFYKWDEPVIHTDQKKE
ncbi:MAG: hypothetical protein JSV94_06915 [Methanobacteriota archaeon]|nr:MAG: hypothetical protein JSV94_06915 [Euryarchaeota archaeon]